MRGTPRAHRRTRRCGEGGGVRAGRPVVPNAGQIYAQERQKRPSLSLARRSAEPYRLPPKWRCVDCGDHVDVYDGVCDSCEKKRERVREQGRVYARRARQRAIDAGRCTHTACMLPPMPGRRKCRAHLAAQRAEYQRVSAGERQLRKMERLRRHYQRKAQAHEMRASASGGVRSVKSLSCALTTHSGDAA